MFYLYFSLFNKNIHEVKNIAIHIVSCHTYRDMYRIVKMCIVTSLPPMGIRNDGNTGNKFGFPKMSKFLKSGNLLQTGIPISLEVAT